jgi:hypothetical protein
MPRVAVLASSDLLPWVPAAQTVQTCLLVCPLQLVRVAEPAVMPLLYSRPSCASPDLSLVGAHEMGTAGAGALNSSSSASYLNVKFSFLL